MLYFSVIYKQRVLIITAPADNAKQKIFLGYDWSNRKGDEGIIINTPGGMMYDDTDRLAENTLSALIRNTFKETESSLPSHEEYYKYADLKDIRIGGTPSRKNAEYFSGTNLWVSIAEMNGQVITDTKEKITDEAVNNSNVKLIPKGTTLLSFKLSIGKTAIAGVDLYTNEAIAALIPLSESIKNEYLFTLFSGQLIDLQNVGSKAFGKSLNSNYLRTEVKIPVPPLEIQQKIVDECTVIDEEYNTICNTIEKYRQKIEKLFSDLETMGGETVRLDSLVRFNPSKAEIKDIDGETQVSFIEMASVSNDGFIESMVNRKLDDLRKGSYTYFAENDILIAKITPCMENGKCGIATGLTSGIGMGSSEFHVIRCSDKVDNRFIFGYLNRESIRVKAHASMTGSSGHRRVPITFYEGLLIPIIPLTEQKEICQKADEYISEIRNLKEKIKNIGTKKQDILTNYLK